MVLEVSEPSPPAGTETKVCKRNERGLCGGGGVGGGEGGGGGGAGGEGGGGDGGGANATLNPPVIPAQLS